MFFVWKENHGGYWGYVLVLGGRVKGLETRVVNGGGCVVWCRVRRGVCVFCRVGVGATVCVFWGYVVCVEDIIKKGGG